jgi:hypothetical protein
VVFDNYCNQGADIAIQPANSNAVTQYIINLPGFSLLGPCAGSALSYSVQVLTHNYCPSAQAELATCACTKNQNSLSISEYVNSLVLNYCGSTHSEDVTSAQGVFAAGLGMERAPFPPPLHLRVMSPTTSPISPNFRPCHLALEALLVTVRSLVTN